MQFAGLIRFRKICSCYTFFYCEISPRSLVKKKKKDLTEIQDKFRKDSRIIMTPGAVGLGHHAL